MAAARAKLYEARKARVAPGLDDKVLTAWNGLMISAFAEGHRVLREPRYLQAAERAASFLLTTLRKPDGRLLRTWRQGTAHIDAFLEDYAYLANGLVDLYEAGGDERFLRAAEDLAALVRSDFGADEGGFYSTAQGHERLVVRHREGHEERSPPPTGWRPGRWRGCRTTSTATTCARTRSGRCAPGRAPCSVSRARSRSR